MNESNDTVYERLAARYASGDVPWDDDLPPPEVLELISNLPLGKALDLGCGYGRAAIYLASEGWRVDAVDFIPQAIAEATRRAADAGEEVRFHVAKVTDLDFLTGHYDFALDVGCGHSLNDEALGRYRDQLYRLLRPEGLFLFFVRIRELGQAQEGPTGLEEQTIMGLFANGFVLEWMARGMTETEDGPSWASAWFCFRRT